MPLRGEMVGDIYVRSHVDGRGMDRELERELEGFDAGKVGRRQGRRYGSRFVPAAGREIGNGLAKEIAKSLARGNQLKAFERSVSRLDASVKRINAGQANFGETLSRSIDRTRVHIMELRRDMNALGFDQETLRGFDKAFNRIDARLARTNPRFALLRRNLDGVSTRIGRLFGRRSRSDLVHFFGLLTEGMTRIVFSSVRLGEGLFNAGRSLFSFAKDIGDAVKQAQSFGQAMGRIAGVVGSRFAAMGSAMGAAGPAAAALGAGILVLVAVLGVLVSAISGVVAALTALVGTLTLGVIGALAAVAGALLPVVAGVGVLVGGIASLDDATKKALKNSLKPLGDEFKRLGRIGAGEIFKNAGDQAKRLAKALKDSKMEGLVKGIGVAIREIGDSWTKAISGPGFKKFIKVMTDNLPSQLKSLGESAKNIFSGMAGVFVAMQPLVNRFVGWLERITSQFSAWANSAAGQSSLARFFQDVGDAAAAVGRVIGAITVALGDLFRAGNSTGISIFDDIAGQFQKLSAYIRANPDAVGDWFEHGLSIIRGVGDAIGKIIDVIRALDTPTNRALAVGLFKAIEFQLGLLRITLSAVSTGISWLIQGLVIGFGAILDAAGALFGALGHVPGFGWASDVGKKLDGVSDAAYRVVDGLQAANNTSVTLDVNDDQVVTAKENIDTTLGNFYRLTDAGKGAGPIEFEVTDNGTIKKTFDSMEEFFKYVEDKSRDTPNALDRVFTAATDAINDAVGHATGELKNLNEILTQGLSDIPPVDLKVNPNGVQGAIDLTGLLTQGLKGVPPVTDATVTDNNTIVPLMNRFGGLQIAAENLPFSTDVKVTDKGTAKVLRDAFYGVLTPLEDAEGTHHSKLKGKISPSNFGSKISGIASALARAAGTFVGSFIGKAIGRSMAGRIASSPMISSLAEDGKKEAVVPLERPLALVDPAVRDIAAFAQGKLKPTGDGSGGRTIDASGWTVVSRSENAETVATEVLNEIVGKLL